MIWTILVIAVLYWFVQRCRHRTLFTNRLYKVGYAFQVADHRDGRCYGKLTPAKVQRLRDFGFGVHPRPFHRTQIVVPAYSWREAFMKARDAALDQHIMVLW